MRHLRSRIFVLVTLVCQHSAATVQVTDDLDRSVTLEKPAQRVIALAPHIVENLFAAGAGSTLVGAVSYSNYPNAAKKIPEVGTYNSFSKEAILALKPDLVLLWASGNGERRIRELEALGLQVYADEPRQLEDIARSLRQFGILTGFARSGAQASDNFIQQLKQLRRQYQHNEPVSVFYEVWNKPLQTLNDEHLVSDVIRMCGGKNIFADALPLAPKINIEAVIQRNPDVIIASGMAEKRPEWLENWTSWPGLEAARHGHLYFIPPDHLQRHTPRVLLGAARMCRQLDQVRGNLDVQAGSNSDK